MGLKKYTVILFDFQEGQTCADHVKARSSQGAVSAAQHPREAAGEWDSLSVVGVVRGHVQVCSSDQ